MAKFDVAIMNPPYSKRLHLDILENVIPVANETINISPTGWLKDIPAVLGWKNTVFQRYENSIAKHIKKVYEIDAKQANDMFAIGSYESIDIISLDNKTYDVYKEFPYLDNSKDKTFFDKVIRKVYSGEVDNIKNNIAFSTIHGHPGSKDMLDIITPQYDIAKRFKPDSMSETEFKNWWKSCQTKFMKYCNLLTRQGQHIHPEYLPFMKDYSEEWTDERFCSFFEISEEEFAFINNKSEFDENV